MTQAHRSHFYQQATDTGLSALQVSARVFLTNAILAILAALTFQASAPLQALLFACGAGAVALLLLHFGYRKRLPA